MVQREVVRQAARQAVDGMALGEGVSEDARERLVRVIVAFCCWLRWQVGSDRE